MEEKPTRSISARIALGTAAGTFATAGLAVVSPTPAVAAVPYNRVGAALWSDNQIFGSPTVGLVTSDPTGPSGIITNAPHYSGNDCTNLISYALFNGGVPMDGTWNSGPGGGTVPWINVSAFVTYASQQRVINGSFLASGSAFMGIGENMPGPGKVVDVGDSYTFHFDTTGAAWDHIALDVFSGRDKQHIEEWDVADDSGFTLHYQGQQVRHINQHTKDRYRFPWNYGWLRNYYDPSMNSAEAISARQKRWVVAVLHVNT